MVIRGAGGRIAGPRRRRPDWDNTVNDLKPLKLTPAELDARSKAFKSKDWSQPRKSPSSGCSRDSEDVHFGDVDRVAEKPTMNRNRREETVALKESSNCTSDDDFDEDIRRLESLQLQQPQLACNQQLARGIPNLLQYLETEMQKAWSEMSVGKENRTPKRKKIRKRLKLHVGQKKNPSTNELKMLDMVLAHQKSNTLSTNQCLVQELQKHVQYQQQVIQELNSFRISATKELANLVELVQKLLSVQECKSSLIKLENESTQEDEIVEAKDTPVLNGTDSARISSVPDSATNPSSLDHNGTPPKPREVPVFLKQRAVIVHPPPHPQLQCPPCSTEADLRRKDANLPTQTTRPAENKRRLPSAKPSEEATIEGQVSADEFDRRENPLFEADKVPRVPFKKSRLQERSSSPKRPADESNTAVPTDKKDSSIRLGSDQVPAGGSLVFARESQTESSICLPLLRKPNLEAERFISVSNRKKAMLELQEGPSKLPESRMPIPRAGEGKSTSNASGPRYKLHGWSAAFLETERTRGKENSGRRIGNRKA